MGKTQNIGTYILNNGSSPYLITASDGVSRAAFLLSTGGSATIQGNASIRGFGGISTAINLVPDVSFIVSTNNENEFIDTLTITITSGTVTVIANQ